jgi:threonyl-tRNA synthetase
VDAFRCTVTQKGRSKIVEEPNSKTTDVKDALLVLASVEKRDEANPLEVSRRTVEEIVTLGHRLKVDQIVLHPFAHLFGQLSTPEVAVKTLELTKEGLTARGFTVTRTPFGWFNTLELKAKGHPLSRVARTITAE